MSQLPEVPKSQVLANVSRWRRQHGLDPKPRRRFINPPQFIHKGDRQAQGRGK